MKADDKIDPSDWNDSMRGHWGGDSEYISLSVYTLVYL